MFETYPLKLVHGRDSRLVQVTKGVMCSRHELAESANMFILRVGPLYPSGLLQ